MVLIFPQKLADGTRELACSLPSRGIRFGWLAPTGLSGGLINLTWPQRRCANGELHAHGCGPCGLTVNDDTKTPLCLSSRSAPQRAGLALAGEEPRGCAPLDAEKLAEAWSKESLPQPDEFAGWLSWTGQACQSANRRRAQRNERLLAEPMGAKDV